MFRVFILKNVSTPGVVQQEKKISADEIQGIMPKEAHVLYLKSPFQVFILQYCINSLTTYQQVKNEWRTQYPLEEAAVVHFKVPFNVFNLQHCIKCWCYLP